MSEETDAINRIHTYLSQQWGCGDLLVDCMKIKMKLRKMDRGGLFDQIYLFLRNYIR